MVLMERKKNILDFAFNFDSLKVMLVLYRDNPDLALHYIEKETCIPREKLNAILTDLIKNEFVDVKTQNSEKVYSLSESVRLGFEKIGVEV